MIPLIDILERIRKDKGITKYRLMRELGITKSGFSEMMATKDIPTELIVAWLRYLEINIPDIEPLLEYQERVIVWYRIYKILYSHFPDRGNYNREAANILLSLVYYLDIPNNKALRETAIMLESKYAPAIPIPILRVIGLMTSEGYEEHKSDINHIRTIPIEEIRKELGQ